MAADQQNRPDPAAGDPAVNNTQQPGAQNRRQMEVRVDEREMITNYANGFRTHTTPEEVLVDFGLNLVTREPSGEQQAGQVNFEVTDRIIMNYYTAKRLALSLGQIIRRHEEQFGELQLNVAQRAHQQRPQS